MNYREFTGKNVDEALANAKAELNIAQPEYEVIDKGAKGLFGKGQRDAVIKVVLPEETVEAVEEVPAAAPAEVIETVVEETVEAEVVDETTEAAADKNEDDDYDPYYIEDLTRDFLEDVLEAMGMEAELDVYVDEDDHFIDVEISGDDMGILIGKRGQTLDSLQYLCSLAVNKKTDDYYRVRLDTEDYRYRREETLKNLAKSIAAKVKRTRRAVSLEPMNPYERRVIHATLQNDRFVTTKSDGEEPYRHVVICLKKKGDNE